MFTKNSFISDCLEKHWGKDAQEFKPERWESDRIAKEAFIPFHLGPQTCMFPTCHSQFIIIRILLLFFA